MERLSGRELDAAIARLLGYHCRENAGVTTLHNASGCVVGVLSAIREEEEIFSALSPRYSSDPAAALELLAWAAQQDWYMQARIWGPNTNHDEASGEFACSVKWNAGPVLLDANGDADTLPAAIVQAVYAALSARQGAREEE